MQQDGANGRATGKAPVSSTDWRATTIHLVNLSRGNLLLRDIFEEEIKSAGTALNVAVSLGMRSSTISEFMRGIRTFSENDLKLIVKHLGPKYPKLKESATGMLMGKFKLPHGLGPVTSCEPDMINLWVTLMEKTETLNLRKDKLAAQFGGFGKLVYDVLTTKPSNEAMRKFEKAGEHLLNKAAKVNYDEVNNSKTLYDTKLKKVRPLQKTGRKVGSAESDPDSNPKKEAAPLGAGKITQAKFKALVDACAKKFGSQSRIIAECQKVDIPIKRTSLRDAYSNGRFGPAAEAFFELAPGRLLYNVGEDISDILNTPGEVIVGDEDHETHSTEELPFDIGKRPTPAIDLNAQNFEQHTKDLIGSENFLLNFESQLGAALVFLNIAVQASPKQRQQIVDRYGSGILSQLDSSLQALRAEDPQALFEMILGRPNGDK